MKCVDHMPPPATSAAAAVDATWTTRALKNGAIYPTYYNAGSSGEACGANANGWRMYQWGTQACGLAGKTAAQIAAKVVDGAASGSVVLMHLGGYHTFEALPSMVLGLRAEPLVPSTISDLLG